MTLTLIIGAGCCYSAAAALVFYLLHKHAGNRVIKAAAIASIWPMALVWGFYRICQDNPWSR